MDEPLDFTHERAIIRIHRPVADPRTESGTGTNECCVSS
jgi:hypothetical protein